MKYTIYLVTEDFDDLDYQSADADGIYVENGAYMFYKFTKHEDPFREIVFSAPLARVRYIEKA